MTTYWAIRQNPLESTDQDAILDLIISKNIVTCPYGHVIPYSHNLENGLDNNNLVRNNNLGLDNKPSKNQDTMFCNDIKIGDIICIFFKTQKTKNKVRVLSGKNRTLIIARITSEALFDQGLKGTLSCIWDNLTGDLIKITSENNTSKYSNDPKKYRVDGDFFSPVYRKIEILKICKDNEACFIKHFIQCLNKIKKDKTIQLINEKINTKEISQSAGKIQLKISQKIKITLKKPKITLKS